MFMSYPMVTWCSGIIRPQSTDKTQAVRTFLLDHPNVYLHFTPMSLPGSTTSSCGSRRLNGPWRRGVGQNAAPAADGSTHWSTRKLGRVLQIHHNLVANARQRTGLQPHRFERYMQSDDPDFEPGGGRDRVVWNPPDHPAVFAVDEKTAIQALDRLDPVLPLSPGRAERHGFEYHRRKARRPITSGSPNTKAIP
jgi:hypothetical protein